MRSTRKKRRKGGICMPWEYRGDPLYMQEHAESVLAIAAHKAAHIQLLREKLRALKFLGEDGTNHKGGKG